MDANYYESAIAVALCAPKKCPEIKSTVWHMVFDKIHSLPIDQKICDILKFTVETLSKSTCNLEAIDVHMLTSYVQLSTGGMYDITCTNTVQSIEKLLLDIYFKGM